MAMAKKNPAAKALQAIMAKEKKHDASVRLEWEMACNTNSQRGHVYDQSEIMDLYDRDSWGDADHGATKTVHLENHLGGDFRYIVVKRHQTGGYLPELRNKKATGNQLIDEINCWQEFAESMESDLLCPILKYFTSKSDKVSATSETMQRNVIIIAQRAVKVGSADRMCHKAEEMNRENGFRGETAESRYRKLEKLSDSKNWRDAMYNPGNSGIIFDYAKNCYKAVFIDYVL